MRLPRPAIAVALLALLAAGAGASTPTDAEVVAKVNEFAAWGVNKDPATIREEIGPRLLDAFDVKELTPRQIGILGQYYVFDGSKVVDAYGAADAASDGDTPEAATGATVAAWLWMKQQRVPPSADELLGVLDHPGFDEALASGSAYQIYELAGIFVSHQQPAEVAPLLPRLVKLAEAIPTEMGHEGALMAGQFAVVVGEHAAPEVKSRIDARAVAALSYAVDHLQDAEKYMEPALKSVSRKISFIGGPAPDFAFEWKSDGLDADSIAGLKGNVVVLDFWATWCAPCIAAFPKVADLVAHYEGYPVKVIGVTQLQGFHRDLSGKRTNTKDEPQAEYALMKDFMGPAGITWPVVFAKGDAMSEYSVTGIPHLAFIAPDGTIRFNGLNPHALKAEEEHAMIDEMLKEAGLPYPGQHQD